MPRPTATYTAGTPTVRPFALRAELLVTDDDGNVNWNAWIRCQHGPEHDEVCRRCTHFIAMVRVSGPVHAIKGKGAGTVISDSADGAYVFSYMYNVTPCLLCRSARPRRKGRLPCPWSTCKGCYFSACRGSSARCMVVHSLSHRRPLGDSYVTGTCCGTQRSWSCEAASW
jgi:hypothetical protein